MPQISLKKLQLTVRALSNWGIDFRRPWLTAAESKLQKLMTYSADEPSWVALDMLPGYLLQLKDALGRLQLLKASVSCSSYRKINSLSFSSNAWVSNAEESYNRNGVVTKGNSSIKFRPST